MKRKIKLTESDLHRVIKESVKSILNEEFEDYKINEINKRISERWRNFGSILHELAKDDEKVKWIYERFMEFYRENEENLNLLHAAYKEDLKDPNFKSGVMGL